MTRIYTALLAASVSASPVMANEFEDWDALDARIAQLAEANPVDRRIKLARCPEPTLLEPGQGIIAVRCVPLGWRLRVAAKSVATKPEVVKPVIRRGQAVNVMIVGEQYSVSYDGTAVDDGSVGADIRVKFSTQGAFQTGTVTGPGKVQILD